MGRTILVRLSERIESENRMMDGLLDLGIRSLASGWNWCHGASMQASAGVELCLYQRSRPQVRKWTSSHGSLALVVSCRIDVAAEI